MTDKLLNNLTFNYRSFSNLSWFWNCIGIVGWAKVSAPPVKLMIEYFYTPNAKILFGTGLILGLYANLIPI